MVVGHAGSGFFTPFNPFNPLPPSSLRSVLQALDRGAEGIEVDLELSRDSVPVLYHDVTLETMTKTGRGCVSEQTAAALIQLQFQGGWPYDWFHREKMVTLDTLLGRLEKRGRPFPYLHLDLHEDLPCLSPVQRQRHSAALARQLVALLRLYHVPAERVLVVSDQPATLARVHQLWPAATLGFEVTHDFESQLTQALAQKVQAVVLSQDLTTPENVARAHAAGLAVITFGGRSGRLMRRLIAAGPDGYEADNVPKLLKLLGRPRPRR
ncbi:hypothetical protein LJY25_10970 [Hymenobacter sp. BT175]|uniref:glycerophosphodiester phosphodiesterase n=1 Tax=Hymenobacter translucens TaxID=2886507 RepID=UPI001D0EA130|nr:glycerophosphodiester phosphodiesterase family protein [Hymenobacter translucens]MCC2546968.1 hypothetical protein [Hymenobacter translucens]